MSKKEPLISLKKATLICKQLLGNEELDDIIIFGSSIKGKKNANDLDLCFVLNKPNDDLVKSALDKFEKEDIAVHITRSKFSSILDDSMLWKTLIHEGFSIRKGKNISDILGLKPYLLFQYILTRLDITKKQSFSHALYGSGGRVNYLKKLNGLKIGRNAVAVPLETSEELRAFFETWNLTYEVKRIWL